MTINNPKEWGGRHVLRDIVRFSPALRTLVDSYRRWLYERRFPHVRTVRLLEEKNLYELRQVIGRNVAASLKSAPKKNTVLVEGMSNILQAQTQFPVVIGFLLAGYRPVVLLNAATENLEAAYRLVGVSDFIYFQDFLPTLATSQVDDIFCEIMNSENPHAFRYKDYKIVVAAISTLMRRKRRGTIDLKDPLIEEEFKNVIADAILYAEAAAMIFSTVAPDALAQVDRGYTPSAQLFEAAIQNHIPAYTLNAAHRDNSLMLKLYDRTNHRDHPSSLSENSWLQLTKMPWSDRMWQDLHCELEYCYKSGEWYSEVGTQFKALASDQSTIVQALELDSSKKTIVIFPHLFWDATFFWGDDLFDNYEQWFCETLKCACANDSVNWLIKIHPANIVKDIRDGNVGEYSEITAIARTVSSLPPHIKLIPADSGLSTFSLFSIIDGCVTVRGTVGIEAACFGIPVLTAGTGRYDRRGFTHDFNSRDEYLAMLGNAKNISPLSAAQTELARRYAYGLLLMRPVRLSSIRIGYQRDDAANLRIDIDSRKLTSVDPGEDLKSVAEWIQSGTQDYIGTSEKYGHDWSC